MQGSVRLDNFSEPELDLLLLRPREDFYANATTGPFDVLLWIEVSESSLGYDRDIKLPLYARVGIPEVWIIDVVDNQLSRHANPVGGRWTVENSITHLATVAPRQLSDVSLNLSKLFG